MAGMFLFLIPAREVKANGASWYDSSWLYREPITIDNTGNASDLTNHQIEVTLNSSDLDFSKAQMFGTDIRFTDSDGITELNYWIESYKPATPIASIWVKIPSIPASSTKTIYLYYGNQSYTNTTYQTYHLSVDSTIHNDYGLSYPVTYEFLIPSGSSGL